MNDPAFKTAFEAENRRDQIAHSTLASVLSMILMPAGTLMDYKKYGSEVGWYFLKLRVCSSLLVGVVWLWFHMTGRKHYRVFGVGWYIAPMVFILWMIHAARDPQSPYYAGLNLVLLALGLLSPWTYRQNLISALALILLFIGALPRNTDQASIYSNLFFISSTATIVVAGSYASYRQRYREFQLRWELDRNKRELEESNRKLMELDEIKSRFFANISHELRTPLTLLLAPLETMLQRFHKSLDEETRSLLLTMRANGMRLLKLINDLLDLVRLESGRMEVKKEPVALSDFMKGLASAGSALAADKRITLTCDVDARIRTVAIDRDKLEKIVLNLVFNALKFTPTGGRVELKVTPCDQDLVISVADTGVGISEKNLPYVFDRFWQADGSSNRKHQGVGIGLALVKELTEIQGGQVTVESTVGVGTTFRVALPYQPADAPVHPAPLPTTEEVGTVSSEEWLTNLYRRAELFPGVHSAQPVTPPLETANSNGHPTILLADDEPDMLRFLKSQLSLQYRVIEAVDGDQAVEKSGQFLPDLVVLDMMMPGRDGLEACRALRETPSTRSIPVLLLTARADEETKLAALSAGANDFLAKPFSTTELLVRIKNLVDSYAYQCKLAKQKSELENTIDLLKETETQLVQAEKLASLGRMSAGIIHEINNPLNYAATGLFTLRKKGAQLAPRDQMEYNEILNDVEEGLTRVKTIVTDLRTFTRPDTESREKVDLVSAVASALRFTSSEWKNTVEIEQSLPEHLVVVANKNKMIQVLVNLLQNSLDALKSKPFKGEKPTIWLEGAEQKGMVVLKIRDNGIGIPPENRDKIFDPFFTTKEVGQGMGLGLSICYRILQEFNGRIRVRSETGLFCEFSLEFSANPEGKVN